MGMPEGCNVHLSEGIRQAVDIPVIVAGKLGDPLVAEKVLREGKADLIAFGRSLLADPDLPRKVTEGRLEDIRPCIYCNDACSGNISRMWSIRCVVNPGLGKEKEHRLEQTRKSKRLLIVGGGPAGMEAARVAALRGHDVTLWEKSGQLGGQLNPASVPGFKKAVKGLLEYYTRQMSQLDIQVELGREADTNSVKEFGPDAVILATGSEHRIPNIPGAESDNVVTAIDLLQTGRDVGERVIVIGGGEVGSEVAWYLAEQGKKVSIVEMSFGIAGDMNMFSQFYLMDRLAQLGVEIVTATTAEEISPRGVIVSDSAGEQRTIEGEIVVLAIGFRSNDDIEDPLKGEVPELYAAGSCVRPGKIWEAVHDGSRVGREI
jgi:NADPH-dependent 2,4-dienoyl-CoA reductase/sulfur reductase-like enzyme